MNRHLLLALLFLSVIPVFSQDTPTVVVFDLSFSMSLPATESASRKEVLLSALEDRIARVGSASFALVTFSDVGPLSVTETYPATASHVINSIRQAVTWGRSPVLEAVEFAARYAAGISADAGILLVTDGEDDRAYLGLYETQGRAGSPRLDLITLDRAGQASSPLLPVWVQQSGGDVVLVQSNGQTLSETTPGLSAQTHESPVKPAEGGSATPAEGRSPFLRFLSAWLLVTRINLGGAAAAGAVAVFRSVRRSRRRRDRVRTYNARPYHVTLEVRTTIRRLVQTYSSFPIRVGTAPGCTLALEKTAGKPPQQFSLSVHDDSLVYSSDEKLNVNGVPRTSLRLENGDQLRLGKYRVTVEEFTVRKPVPEPVILDWQTAVTPALALLAGVALLFLRPLPIQQVEVTESLVRQTAVGSQSDTDHAPLPVPPPDDSGRPGGFSPLTQPVVYSWSDRIEFFDADYLLIHAHPDDESLDNGVLLSRLHAAGLTGIVVLLTDGQSGLDQYPERPVGGMYPASDLAGARLAEVRIAEAANALGHLGVKVYVRGQLPNFPYNSVTDELTTSQVLRDWGGIDEIASRLEELIAGYSPELVISPDGPAGPLEHFEHESVGLAAAAAVDRALTRGADVKAHLMGVDPLQVQHYSGLVEISPWDINPVTGRSYRAQQLLALAEHRTQRDASSVGIETRLAVPGEYYSVAFWHGDFTLPEEVGIRESAGTLAGMERTRD